jgi:HAE1 family hydrophobic/amphiphilic exporter-1
MFSMPTMFIGAAFGLFVTGTPISMVSLIGVIMLAGIVVNNGIILVDYINIVRRRGVERDEAILIASPSRVRPILMTALTTVLGMVPLALGIGEGAETQAPLAITVIFGLLFSTFFTLVFVPVMYTYMDGLSNRFRRLFSWRPFARRRKKSEGLEARM